MNVVTVADAEGLARVAARVRSAPRVGVDTEFHNERSYTAHLMVVQLAFEDEVVIVDPLGIPSMQPLADALAEVTIVGHALSSDLKIFADSFDRLPAAAFDTQVAAAFCGFGLTISLLDLVRELAGVTLRKSQTVSDWSTRPLTPKQIDYLVDDVKYLFPLHDALTAKLAARGRLEWASEESRSLVDRERYASDANRLYLRVGGNARMNRRELGILRELAVVRDRLARERNVPLKYVIPDDVLIGLVGLRPKSLDELSQLRRLDAGIKKHFGKEILEAVAAGEELAEDDLPPRAPRPLSAQRESLVSTMSVLVNAIAVDNDVPTTLLLPRAGLEKIARELPPSIAAMNELLGLAPWRESLVVEPLWRMLAGETTISVTGYREGQPRTHVG